MVYPIILLGTLLLLLPILVKSVQDDTNVAFSYFSLKDLGEVLFFQNYIIFELISLLFFLVLIVGVFLLKKYENE